MPTRIALLAALAAAAMTVISAAPALAQQAEEGEPGISVSDESVVEGNFGHAVMQFKVTLSGPSDQNVKVDYDTADGTATAPEDYLERTGGVLLFRPGETEKNVNVAAIGDTVNEADETMQLRLSNPVRATIAKDAGVGTIVDDERDGRFTCRASLLRVGGFEPFIANDRNDPCTFEEEGITGSNAVAGEALVATRTEGRPNPPAGGTPSPDDIVVSHTEAADLHVNGGAGAFLVRVQGLVSSASVKCDASGSPEMVGSSKAARVSLLGQDITTGPKQRTINLGIGTLHLNRTLRSDNQVIQRAVEVDLPGQALDVVIGDTRAGFRGEPCQG